MGIAPLVELVFPVLDEHIAWDDNEYLDLWIIAIELVDFFKGNSGLAYSCGQFKNYVVEFGVEHLLQEFLP